jgi:hypothetical protein
MQEAAPCILAVRIVSGSQTHVEGVQQWQARSSSSSSKQAGSSSSSSSSMQQQHAAAACSSSMQQQHAAAACSSSSMQQQQHAAAACSSSMQQQHAAALFFKQPSCWRCNKVMSRGLMMVGQSCIVHMMQARGGDGWGAWHNHQRGPYWHTAVSNLALHSATFYCAAANVTSLVNLQLMAG